MVSNGSGPWPEDEVTRPERLSAAGLDFLKSHEGFRSHMYDDVKGYCTVGYGHLVHKGRTGTNPQAEAPFAAGLSIDAATALLAKDVSWACDAVIKLVTRQPLKQHEFDALVDFTFNVGTHAFATSTLLKRVNALVPAGAITEAFLMWDKPIQLLGRRKAEAWLFNTGAYK
jgi:GH24 family phage-related lysozyme (muramidase)